ncbi:MAG: hypothetical protein NTX97_10640, partial [Bacteroidetes bacterium]|nr:hypothetical protein [Bacteroidota bacterium]
MVLFLLVQIRSIQIYAGHQASKFFSEKFKTRVEIGSLEIDFFKKVVLDDVYIEDLHHDTLLYSKKLKIDIGSIDLEKHQLYVSDIMLLNTKSKLIKYLKEDDLNFQFIIDAFASSDTTKSKPSVPWDIQFGAVNLVNTDFTYRSEHDTLETTGVNYFDLNVKHVNSRITDIKFEQDTIHATIDYLAAVEKSGFILQNLSCYVNLSPVGMKLDELRIKTPESEIATDLSFKYDNYRAFQDFIDAVKIKAEFDHSHVEMSDIAYFAPQLKGIYRNITLTGKVSGTVSDLKGKDMELKIASNT